jgi:hypothetical protein
MEQAEGQAERIDERIQSTLVGVKNAPTPCEFDSWMRADTVCNSQAHPSWRSAGRVERHERALVPRNDICERAQGCAQRPR